MKEERFIIEKIAKKCIQCDKILELSEFYKDNEVSSGYNIRCKYCIKENTRRYLEKKIASGTSNNSKYNYIPSSKDYQINMHYVHKYGITLEEYNLLFSLQKGRCKICSKHQSELKRALSVDHCHTTKKIRGLLCDKCNPALGGFMDSIEILKSAIEYLENSSK